MQATVVHRVELELVEDGVELLAVVQYEVYDKGVGGIGESLELLLVHREEDVLHAEAIEVARDDALLAEGLDDRFVADLTDLAVQFKMLHFCKC